MTLRLKADISNLASGLQMATAQMSTFAKGSVSAINTVGKNMQNIGRGMRSFGTEMAFLGTAMTASIGVAVKASADFEKAVLNAASVTGALTENEVKEATKAIGDLAKELGETTVFSAAQAADAMYDLASKGFNVTKMSVKEMQPFLDLAAATQTDLTTTTEVMTATIRAFGMETSESGRVADTFGKTIAKSAATMGKFRDAMSYVGPIAHTAGISLEETSAALGKIFDLGFPASMAGTALRRAFAELLTPSAKLEEALAGIGLKFEDIDLKTNGFVGTLRQLDEAGLTAEKAIELFGQRAGPTIAALLGVDSSGQKAYESIKELTTTLENSQGVVRQMAEVQLESLANRFELVKSKAVAVLIEIGEALTPELKILAGEIENVLSSIKNWVVEHPKLTANIAKFLAIGGPLITLLGVLSFSIGSILSLVGGLIQGFAGLVTGIGGVVKAFATFAFSTKALTAALTVLRVVGIGLLVTAVLASVAAVVKATMAFFEWQKAAKGAQDAQNRLADDVQKNYDRMAVSLSKAYEERANENQQMREQLDLIYDLINRRRELSKQAMEDGKVSQDEAKQLNELGQEIITQTRNLEALNQGKKTVAQQTQDIINKFGDAEKATKELTDEERELIESSLDVTDALDKTIDGLKKTKDSSNIASNEIESLTASIQELSERSKEPFLFEVDWSVQGADELRSVQEEILRLEHEIQLERLEGWEKEQQQIKFTLEENLLALRTTVEQRAQEHQERMQQIKTEAQQEIETLEERAEKDEAYRTTQFEADKKMILQTAQDKMRAETEVAERTIAGYEKIHDLYIIQADEKLQKIAKANEGHEEEIRLGRDIVSKASEGVKEFNAQAEAIARAADEMRRLADNASQVSYGGSGGGGGVTQRGTVRITQPTTSGGFSGTTSGGSGTSYTPMTTTYDGQEVTGYRKMSFQRGTAFVPRTGMAMVHEGEGIVPRGMMAGQGGAGNVEITIVNQMDAGFVNSILEANPNTVVNIINSDVAKGGTTKKTLLTAVRGR